MPYYFNSNTYQADWDNPDNISTTFLNDGSIGDRTTHNSCSSFIDFAPPAITAFYDAGLPVHVPRSQFGIETLSLGTLRNGQFIIEGSSNHSSWTTLASGSLITPMAAGYDFAVGFLQTAYFQYFRLSIQFDDDGNPGTDETGRLALYDWRLIQPQQRDTMRDLRYLQAGGLLPLLTEPIPAISSSTAIFANAPDNTVMAEVTVKSSDLIIMWNVANDASPDAATTSAGGGQTYGAGDRYVLEFSRDVLRAARAIQASATCTGTITYYGLRS